MPAARLIRLWRLLREVHLRTLPPESIKPAKYSGRGTPVKILNPYFSFLVYGTSTYKIYKFLMKWTMYASIALTAPLTYSHRMASTVITRTVRPHHPWSQPPSSLLVHALKPLSATLLTTPPREGSG